MINKGFYTKMIELYASHEGYELADQQRKETLENILRHLQLDFDTESNRAYGAGQVAGMQRARQIIKES